MRDIKINNRWAFFLILSASVIVYFNSIGNSFQYDDKFYIKDNFYIRDAGNIPAAFLHPSYLAVGAPPGHYRPLLFTSYVVNYFFNGLNPAGYRIVNLAFHIGSAFLVFLIVKAMLTPTLSLPHSATSFIAVAVALIFAVHPFNSEVVNYISTRSSVMSAFFYLLAFYFWVKFRSRKPEAGSQGKSYFYPASLLLFLLGMLTKETVITLPVVLWLYDLYFVPLYPPPLKGEGSGWRIFSHIKRLVVYLPFISIVAGAYFAVRIYHFGSSIPSFKRDLLTQLYTEMPVLVKNIRLLFIPAGLNVDHYVTIYNGPTPAVVGSFLFLILVMALSFRLYKVGRIEWRVVSFFLFWFFIVLLPTTIMPLNAILQENRGYVAGVGFALFAGVGLYRVTTLQILHRWFGRRIRLLPVAALLLALFSFSISTIERNMVWRNGRSIWEDSVRKSPLSPRAHHNLAYYYEEEGRVKLAVREYQRVVELDPSYAMAYYNLGRLYRGLGLSEEAIKVYQEAVRIDPDYYKVYNNLGIVYADMGTYDRAIEEFKRAIKRNPGYIMAHMNLGKMYERTGQMDLAVAEFEAVIKFAKPGSGEEEKAFEAAKHLKWIRERGEKKKGGR